MSEYHRLGHRHSRHGALSSADKTKDKENDTITNTAAKKSVLSISNCNDEPSTFGRSILRSKSANGLKVSSSFPKSFNSSHKALQNINNNDSSNNSNNNANKARKITKKHAFSIFDNHKIQNEDIGYHDSTTLQRSQSQMNKEKENNINELSRSSTLGSLFGSSTSTTISSSLNQTRKIKSQLTIGKNTDMADFFKKSKEEEHKQLSLINPSIKIDDNINDNIQEITFADETDDITSMKRIEIERNSPLYQRTHKVSLHSLLSSSLSNDDDNIEETTFDYKDKDKDNNAIMNLENLMMNNNKKENLLSNDNELDIEIVSHNINGKYHENDLPETLEGLYTPMSGDLLMNLWDKPTLVSLEAAKKFEDPLELKKRWNTEENTNKNTLDLNLNEMEKPDELILQFSDNEYNEEFDDLKDEEEDKKLNDLIQFYDKNGQAKNALI